MKVFKGIRVNESTLTSDMSPHEAEIIRKALMGALRLMAMDNEHRQVVQQYCDQLAGPLGATAPEQKEKPHGT